MGNAESHSPTTGELLSIVAPVYNEGDNIVEFLDGIAGAVGSPHETILVYDFEEDTTLAPARRYALGYPELRLLRNEHGRGVLNAIRTGLEASCGDVLLVTMADLSDEAALIDTMAARVREGTDVLAASRYMRGGEQIGGPPLKGFLSRAAGLSLRYLTAIGTHDPTNNYKAYSRAFIDAVEIESKRGFEIGLELCTKAHLGGMHVAEIPTTWRERTVGESRFDIVGWIPAYLKWYTRCVLGTWSGARRRARTSMAHTATSDPRQSVDRPTQ